MNVSSDLARMRLEDLRRDTEHRRMLELASPSKRRRPVVPMAAAVARGMLAGIVAWFARSQLGPAPTGRSRCDADAR